MSTTNNKLKIGIIGLGMVGEPIRKWFEEYHKYRRKKDLFCYDIDPKRDYDDDVNKADIIFVAVPTPKNPDGSCNTSIVENAVKTIKDGKFVIIKSTVVPGTVETLQKKYPRKKFIFNPEFLTESQAWLDFIKPDRQIIGNTSKSKAGTKEILDLLPRAPFERPWSSDYTKKDASATEAEMAKYAANVFGYIKVIYGNILADIAHALKHNFKNKQISAEVDYENIREIISADPRIGPAWLNVEHGDYAGAGGYCFPKDMAAFISFAENLTNELDSNKKNKSEHDKGLVLTLKQGIKVLKSVEDYNKALLKWQGLTIGEVSKHNKEILVEKKKQIRKNN
ncbi:MAG: hypothetical protein COV29_00380 [Candidatus Yanofskybacteria bacterium CG10_big_fil_rev_8_21_14_0_10_36_16]|uniref:UDP-glucose/GDP-mannose dehydrogenase dimerisation domain-containing protein n=1 Tax=Candidatus Yanofskybacteria bacterium CG10_big_fil_rev_8_21_14_0_10_36_16 TaxID=1975096 RepID=A0A2J0QC86_9BACT|nr:MAG: hypothetical protein COV29_00380 [Candidatus Yanofskybacteria bacterium CG10_big_fil_rev_8_21_14_0_10_36_16]